MDYNNYKIDLDDEEITYYQRQYDYMAFMMLVKIVGWLHNQDITSQYLKQSISDELNLFYQIDDFSEDNIVEIGMNIIEEQFVTVIAKLIKKEYDKELSLFDSVLKKIKNIREKDRENGNYQNRGDMLSDFKDGKYYRLFLRVGESLMHFDHDRTDPGFGETLYHTFARQGSEGLDRYFDYFKIMCENNLVNFQNQEQQRGFCNGNPCTYWLLSSKEQMKYFSNLIMTKPIQLNHICGNENGPSHFKILVDMLVDRIYWDRKQKLFLPIDTEFENLLCKTLFCIAHSNFSIGFDLEVINKLLNSNVQNEDIEKMLLYLTSDEAILKQRKNNKYPIYLGGKKDLSTSETSLNENLDRIIEGVKNYKIYGKKKNIKI